MWTWSSTKESMNPSKTTAPAADQRSAIPLPFSVWQARRTPVGRKIASSHASTERGKISPIRLPGHVHTNNPTTTHGHSPPGGGLRIMAALLTRRVRNQAE